MTTPAYPVSFDPDDRRLDDQVVGLVADLLHFKGFPFIGDPGTADFERLRNALHGFVYDGAR